MSYPSNTDNQTNYAAGNNNNAKPQQAQDGAIQQTVGGLGNILEGTVGVAGGVAQGTVGTLGGIVGGTLGALTGNNGQNNNGGSKN